ncbi:MAG: hypothetical protein DCF19_00890 [Pseudanabaena frigida]|uniref:Uncharacterized protein n=1 Tax=Pseudanabaena frigida TaxID=945775 RepID=A0A2W4WKN7_9CYAN|nr:MAG: hypothetical protein DCF19_00890 [Pseudanabaena frigida]
MAEDLDGSENQKSGTDRTDSNNGSTQSNSSKTNSPRHLKLPRFRPNWRLPKFDLPKFSLDKLKPTPKKRNFLWFWLVIIVISYAFMGYFLSVLLTIPSHKNLAIAGFAIFGLLPTITAFADYALMKWSYLISGFLIVGGFVFLIKVKFYLMVLAIVVWLGITTIAFVGESLIKQKHKFFVAIAILTIPCLFGLAAGWQIWRLAAQLS